MTLRKYALDYRFCRTPELQQFAQDRGLISKEPFFIHDHDGLIGILRNADDEAQFPFCRFIPELRNMIYRELLTFKRKNDGKLGHREAYCYPGILQANKEIHKEAKGCWEDNLFEIRYTGLFDVVKPEVKICGHNFSDLMVRPNTALPPRDWSPKMDCLKFLQKIRKLRLVLDVQHGTHTFTLQHHYLHWLVALLQTNSIQELEIRVPDRGTCKTLSSSLWPLCRLGYVQNIKITDSDTGAEKKDAQKVIAKWASYKAWQKRDLMGWWHVLDTKYSDLSFETEHLCGRYGLPEACESAHRRVANEIGSGEPCFLTIKGHRRCELLLGKLEEELNKADCGCKAKDDESP